MVTTTSTTTGSISTAITSDSLSAAKSIVVQEDVYKGATLLGTTYRNISFTTTYTPIVSYTVAANWFTGWILSPQKNLDPSIGSKIDVNGTNTQTTLVKSDTPSDTVPTTLHLMSEDNVNTSSVTINITSPATNGIASSFTAQLSLFSNVVYSQTVTITPTTTQITFTVPPRGVYGATCAQISWNVPARASWTSGTIPRGLRINSGTVSLFQGRNQTQHFYRAIDCFVSNSTGLPNTSSQIFDQTRGYFKANAVSKGMTIFTIPRASIGDFNSTIGLGSLMNVVVQGSVNFYTNDTPTTNYLTGTTVGDVDATTLQGFQFVHQPSTTGSNWYFHAEALTGSAGGLLWGFSNVL